MPTTTVVTDWGMATWTAFTAGLVGFYSFLPSLLGAVLIMLAGWGVAAIAYALADRLLGALRFDHLLVRTGLSRAISASGVAVEPSHAVATLVKWSVLLIAFMMAADAMHLPAVSQGVAGILGYIPKVLAAVAIVALGLLLAGFVGNVVRGGAQAAGLKSGEVLADVAYWSIAVFAALGAIGQLEIAPALVQTLYTGVIAALALAGGLAFGLGLREQAKDVAAGRMLAERLHPGDDVEVGATQGRLHAIGMTLTTLDTPTGRVVLPNSALAEQAFLIASKTRLTPRVTITPASPAPNAQAPGSKGP